LKAAAGPANSADRDDPALARGKLFAEAISFDCKEFNCSMSRCIGSP
jgi:hypothetical protein